MFQTTNQHIFLSSSIHSGFCQKFCQVTVGFPPSGCNDSLVDVAEKSAGNHCQKRIYWSSHFSGLATFADVHLIGFQGDWLISMWGYCDKKTGEGQFCTNNFISKPTQLIQFQVAGSSPNPRCQIVKVILGGQARKTADPVPMWGDNLPCCVIPCRFHRKSSGTAFIDPAAPLLWHSPSSYSYVVVISS